MTIFPDARVRKVPGQKCDVWVLAESCQVFYMNGEVITIEEGYSTDFASVPRILWSIIPPHGNAANASIVHDYLYDKRISDRLLADLFFFYELRKVVPKWQAWVMYQVVRWFGKKWWDN